MTDLSNYYQRDSRNSERTPSGRFPHNHVKYSALLKPLQWIDSAYSLFGSRAFRTMDAILREFDSAAPLDEYLGTEDELKRARMLLVLCPIYNVGYNRFSFIRASAVVNLQLIPTCRSFLERSQGTIRSLSCSRLSK